MPTAGVVITVRNEDAIPLYLAYGVYGPKLRVDLDGEPYAHTYLRTLVEVACCQRDDHLFFRCQNRFYYGGRVAGETDRHTFYLNGDRGFIGRRAGTPLVWGETQWEPFEPPGTEGLDRHHRPSLCQPFLLRFRNWLNLAGRWIHEDQYYAEVSDYRHLLPTTHDLSGLTAISPGEADRLLAALLQEPGGTLEPPDASDIELVDDPMPYDPEFGPTISDGHSADGLAAVVLANPDVVERTLAPARAAIARNVPISPYQRRNVGLVEVGFYTGRRLLKGTLPDVLLYLSHEGDEAALRERLERQEAWLARLLGSEVGTIQRYAGRKVASTLDIVELPLSEPLS